MTKSANTMTKQTNQSAATLTAAKQTAANPFNVGDRVTVCNAATLDEELVGTLVAIQKGWYQVELDEEIENAKGETTNTLSARAGSLALLPWSEEDEEDEQEDGDEQDEQEESDEGDVDEALEEDEEHASKMAEALRKARVRYQKTRRPAGAASADCADLIARELRDYEPEEVCGLADRCFNLPAGTHAAKYDHLNNGQKRMNSGNKIRAAYLKGDEETRARIAYVLGLEDELATDGESAE